MVLLQSSRDEEQLVLEAEGAGVGHPLDQEVPRILERRQVFGKGAPGGGVLRAGRPTAEILMGPFVVLMLDAEPHPPNVQLREAMDATRGERDPVVRPHRARQTELPEGALANRAGALVKRLVSRGGGQEPRWSASGRELFFKSGGPLVAVDVPAGPSLAPGVPRPVFPLVRFRAAQNRPPDDVASDGRRFLMIRSGAGDAKQELIYAANWFHELGAKMKVK